MESFIEILFSLEWQEWFVIALVIVLVFGVAHIDRLANAVGDGMDTVASVFKDGDSNSKQK